jgi:RHS repeat-associated protein
VVAPLEAQEDPPKEEEPQEEEDPKEAEEKEPPPDPEGGSQMMSGGEGAAGFVAGAVLPEYEISGFTGGFSTRVPVRVPSYHGLEPKVAISGPRPSFDVIQRVSSDDGAPRFDGTDLYLLGRSHLRECVGSESPSCDAGGTHWTEHESYHRIVFDSGANAWEVTSPNGTTSRYEVTMGWPGKAYRWGLSSVTDPLNNSVDYVWWCDTDPVLGALDCYPDHVAYNGSEVSFHWESRPDPRTFATGHNMGRTRYRIATVDVQTGGSRVRAYTVDYAVSASSGRSLVSSVRMFGTDADLDGSGHVTGGTSLPATTYTHTNDPSYATFGAITTTLGFCQAQRTNLKMGIADFDGDTIPDVYCWEYVPPTKYLQIAYGAIDGSFTLGNRVSFGCDWGEGFQTGDVNGDGRADFICQKQIDPAGSNFVALGNGNDTFQPWTMWAEAGFCDHSQNQWVKWGLGDVTGDGKTDVWCQRGLEWPSGIQRELVVGVSNGADFVVSQWTNGFCGSGSLSIGSDINGDAMADAVCLEAFGLTVSTKLSTGTSFTTGFPQLSNWCGSELQGSADFNSDGKSDLWCHRKDAGGNLHGLYLAMSDGNSWTDTAFWPAWCTNGNPSSYDRVSTGDMNGDGLTDLYCHTPGTNNKTVRLSKGDGTFGPNVVWKQFCSLTPDNATQSRNLWTADFSGDGKDDLVCQSSDKDVSTYGNLWSVPSGSVRGELDLVKTVENGLGGKTTLTYKPASDWNNEPGYSGGSTVSSVVVEDGRGWSSTTTYEYSGGKTDRAERMNLGFAYSKMILPKLATETLNPYAETWFSQNLASVGAVTKSERRDGAGKIFGKTENTLAIIGNGTTSPYRAFVSQKWSYVFDGTVTGCGSWPCTNGERRYEEYDYDDWGNQIQTRSFGNYDVSGDETTSIAEFYPDTSSYVTNRTARQASYVGIGTAGTKLTESRFFYDGATLHTIPPLVGLLTKTSVWRNTDGQYVPQCNLASCVQYDPFGNVTQNTDIKGGQTTVAYDTLYHVFPTSTTNALGHTTSSAWDELCEAVETVTNPNNQTTTTTYDALCRHERTDGALGSFAESFYQNFGSPTTQYVEVQGPSPNGTGVAWTRTYFDGLGRAYKTEKRGPTTGQEILSGEVTFNQRGGVLTSTAPRYAGETAQVTSYEYDPLERPKKTTLPDLNTIQQSYGLRNTYVTNPEGDITGEARNETGLVRYAIEYLGATPVITTITANLTSRTETTQDYQGNVWVKQLNSLGQVISFTDPDSGTETREYNNAGEMTAVVNALNERTELTYDLLGRMLTKTTRAGTAGAQVTTFTYDQVRATYFNKGFLTRMDDSAGFREDDFDALGRSAKTTRSLDSQNYVFQFLYNTAGLPSSTTYPDSQSISWTYDAVGNLATESGTITASTYDAAGRLKTRNFTGNVVTTYNYSLARGWVQSINTVKSPTVHQNLAYTYYPDGMIQTVTSPKSMESWSYLYDDLNRLVTADNADTPTLDQSFTYNEIGNVTSNSHIGTYTYPTPGTARPHAVSTAGTRSYQYNAIGQMTSRNGTVIQWNGDGKPSSVGNVAFIYDGLGVRLKKVSGGQTTRYIGGDYEIAHDGTVTKYLRGGKKVGAAYFVHHRDHLGSIQAVTDSAGNEVRRQKHKPFGDQHSVSGSHLESKGWIGEREEETELLYFNARYYDPEIGRFTAPDLFFNPGQNLNRYSYSINNPANLSDPSGLCHDGYYQQVTDERGTYTQRVCPTGDGHHRVDTMMFGSVTSLGMTPFTLSAEYIRNHDESVWRYASEACANGDPESCEMIGQPIPSTQESESQTTIEPTTQQPDNILYNCQNEKKPNCGGTGFRAAMAQQIAIATAVSTEGFARSLESNINQITSNRLNYYTDPYGNIRLKPSVNAQVQYHSGNLRFARITGNTMLGVSLAWGGVEAASYYSAGDSYNAGRVLWVTGGSAVLGSLAAAAGASISGPILPVATGAAGSFVGGAVAGELYDWWYRQ